MNEIHRTIRADVGDAQLDQQVAHAVWGYAITDGPQGVYAATIGAGPTTKLVDLPRVSTDLAAAWGAATAALDDGQADGFHAGILKQESGHREYRATFLREQGDGATPICGAVAESMPRAICGALLALYDGINGRRVNAPGSRMLQ